MSTELEQRPEWRLAGIIYFALIALLVFWATLRILWPFVTPILVAAILVTLTYSLYGRLRDRMRGRSTLAAVTMLVGITFLIVIPLFLVTIALVHEANTLIQDFQSGEARQMLARLDLTNRLQFLKRWVPGFDPATLSPQRLVLPIVQEIPGWVARNGRAVVGGIAGLVISFLLLILAMFFFYVQGETILAELAALSPLPPRYDKEFAKQFKDVVDATFRGYVITALAQGVVTAIGLVIAGVPAALFWGAVATVISLLPFIGAAAVWVPAAIYLYVAAALGRAAYWQAIFLTLWGVLAVSVVDNVVRPLVMRGKSQLPAIPLLFSVLGGLQAFGLVGLVLGPLVFSFLMSIIDIYKQSFRISSNGRRLQTSNQS